MTASGVKQAGTMHPLEELTAQEIAAAAEACKAYAAAKDLGRLRFNVITLNEPTKKEILAFEARTAPAPPRCAFCILQTPPHPGVHEAIVDLSNVSAPSMESITSWTKVDGVEALATPDDCLDAEAICKADPQVASLLRERYGLTDMELVQCDPWSVHAAPSELAGSRLIQLFMYRRSSPNDNAYAHPIDMVPLVDLNLKKVVKIDMQKEAPKVPETDFNYHEELQDKPWRTDIKPLDIVQPEGPSFTVDGNLIKWQKWQFRLGFNYREGPVIHQLGYEDGGRLRPVLHRASLVEMAVPYGDPREPYQRKCAFDVGDYGLGYCAVSLNLGCDCLGHIKYFDAVLPNALGEPVVRHNVVCMHEEDVGLLWKHVEFRNGHSESRRSRRLVINSVATVVNYEYALIWYLYQDGTISYEIKLTGELSTNPLSEGEGPEPAHGTLVAPGVNAQHHQHMFCARLDMAVDNEEGGKGLVVSEVDVLPMGKGPKNPHGNGFYAQETALTTTAEAQRMIAPELGRIWKIKNPSVLNPMSGGPVAYKLMPAAGPGLMATDDSVIAKRGVFATKNLWVTPHDDTERFPAGEYVLQSDECRGLKEWTKTEKALNDADPIIWYSFGVTHIVRVEDFPVMPVETTGFHLKPFGFFSGNPGLDIPPTKNAASKLADANGASCCANGTNGVKAANGVKATNGDHTTTMASVENGTNGTAVH